MERSESKSSNVIKIAKETATSVGYEELWKDLETLEAHREAFPMVIARRLIQHLSKGGFKAGDRIPSERQLAEALGIGRAAVRDALRPLALLGLLEVRQGNGTFLKAIESSILPETIEWGIFVGTRETRDLFEARCSLEEMIAGLAAERRSDDDVEVLSSLVAQMRQSERDPSAFTRADVAFHRRVAEAAGNQTLLQIMTSISRLLQVWISRVIRKEGNFPISLAEHEAVLDAITAGDVLRARAAMAAHIRSAIVRLDDALNNRTDEM